MFTIPKWENGAMVEWYIIFIGSLWGAMVFHGAMFIAVFLAHYGKPMQHDAKGPVPDRPFTYSVHEYQVRGFR